MTLQDLADELHRAYQAAPQGERWQHAARAVLDKLNERPTVAAIFDVDDEGTIVELTPDGDEDDTSEPTGPAHG